MFKVGQKVYDIIYQKWGKVVEIRAESHYPVYVKFDGEDGRSSCTYTVDGREHTGFKQRTLYWDIPTISGGTEPPFESEVIGKTLMIDYGVTGNWLVKITKETKTHIYGDRENACPCTFEKALIHSVKVLEPLTLQGMKCAD